MDTQDYENICDALVNSLSHLDLPFKKEAAALNRFIAGIDTDGYANFNANRFREMYWNLRVNQV